MAQATSGDVCSFHPDESVKNTLALGTTSQTHTHDHGPGSHSHDHSHDVSSGPFTLAEHGHTHEHLDHAGKYLSCSVPIISVIVLEVDICGVSYHIGIAHLDGPHYDILEGRCNPKLLTTEDAIRLYACTTYLFGWNSFLSHYDRSLCYQNSLIEPSPCPNAKS